jgi:hypothetical protein
VRKLLRAFRALALGLLVTVGTFVAVFRGGYLLIDRVLSYAYRRAERRHDSSVVAN